MDKYLKERDDYRALDGRPRKWEGVNLRLSHKMMGKNKSVSDIAAVQRVSLDKMWRWHRARDNPWCEACNSRSLGISHPMWRCKHEEMIEYRLRWRKNVWMFIDATKPNERPQFEELWRNMETAEDGAYAACGVFLQGFLEKLTRADDQLTKAQKTKMNRFLKEIGRGARQILKIHRGLCENRVSVELNQTSIRSFLVKKPTPVTGSDEESETDGKVNKASNKKNKKREKKRSRYVNPDTSSDSDKENDNTPRIKNPPSTSTILRKYFHYNIRRGNMGEVVYWEWKAG